MTRPLVVSEVFGPTFQGEGPSAGRPAMFLRLGLCNLDCSWCDTPYTWDWTGKNGPPQDKGALLRLDVAEVATLLRKIDAPLLVITGGEPLLQQSSLTALLLHLEDRYRVEVETNGTIAPTDDLLCLVDGWNVSPKLASSGVDPAKAWRPEVLARFVVEAERQGETVVALKVVCCTPEDVAALAELVDALAIPRRLVWVMPEGRTAAEVVDRLATFANLVVDLGFNVTSRLHVLAWGDRRGV